MPSTSNSLYKSDPTLVDNAPITQKGVIEQMMALPEFDQLRSDTQVDDIASAIGTMELAPHVLEQFNKLKGVENLGKGPIIVCQDKSGSMDGQRDEWATAVAIAMSELATKQNRAFGVIHFEQP
jgi:hypothetical protein